jgi:hypothetical protein
MVFVRGIAASFDGSMVVSRFSFILDFSFGDDHSRGVSGFILEVSGTVASKGEINFGGV